MNLNVDTLELRLYLAVVYDRDQLVDLGLGEVTHTSRFNRGPKPGITPPEILSRSHDTISKFIPPQRSPSNIEKRLMTKLALEYLMRVSLENHIYSFNGYIRLQSSGGAIGDSLTGAIASVFVIHWAREFKSKLSQMNIFPKMLQIYVDDQNIITLALPLGARFV